MESNDISFSLEQRKYKVNEKWWGNCKNRKVKENLGHKIIDNSLSLSHNNTNVAGENFRPIEKEKAVTKQGLWSKIRAFLFQEIDLTAPIKVELTPYQQKVEDEINEFLHQEVSFKGISKFFGFKK